MVLSGEEEARAEWEALQHALDYAPDLDRDLFDGMLSGGGMSCQLAWRGRVTPELFSFRNGVLQPGGLADKANRQKIVGEDLVKELALVRLATKALVAHIPSFKNEQRQGNVALVEWLGLYVAGEPTERDLVMGLGYNKWLTRDQILEAVTSHLGELDADYIQKWEPISRRAAISWVYGIILQTLLEELFDANTNFYCFKGINWSTGHYLMHKEKIATQEPLLQSA
ncbi:unnamed protein product [Durusdinium trenchii]